MKAIIASFFTLIALLTPELLCAHRLHNERTIVYTRLVHAPASHHYRAPVVVRLPFTHPRISVRAPVRIYPHRYPAYVRVIRIR
jgi:hypothetical protein